MNNIIDSIQLSGVTYTLQGSGGGTVDSAITSGSTNPVENQALWDELRIPKNEEVETVLEWENNDGGATTNYPTGASKLEFYIDENEMTEGYFYFRDDGYNELGKIFIEISNGNISVTDYENVTYTISGDVVTVNYSSIAASVVLIYSSYDCNWTVKAYTGGIVYEPIIDQVSANTAAISGKVDTSAITSSVTSASTDSEIPTAKAVFDAIPTGSTSGNPTVELTQAEYDALITAGTVSADTYYIISDATAFDPTTKVDTSAITSSVTSASTDSQIPTAKAVWEAASGGGTTYTAGRGIDITSDTISVSLPISAGTGTYSIAEGQSTRAMSLGDHAEGYGTYANGGTYAAHAEGYQTSAMTAASHAEGRGTKTSGYCSHAEGLGTQANGDYSHAEGEGTIASASRSHAEGYYTSATSVSNVSGIQTSNGFQARHSEGAFTLANNASTHVEGYFTVANNFGEHASGVFNNSSSATTTYGDSGNTLFSVGNGTSNLSRHNAFEIRQNGDIYLSSGGTDIKLQDYLGGTASSAITSGDTNAVAGGAVYDKFNEVEQVTARALNDLNEKINALIEANEVVARALNDLNDRITALENV